MGEERAQRRKRAIERVGGVERSGTLSRLFSDASAPWPRKVRTRVASSSQSFPLPPSPHHPNPPSPHQRPVLLPLGGRRGGAPKTFARRVLQRGG